ncbi:Aspartate-semialdehyde dehydrogenase [invertebrate metagenome]|uniref:aspartate-semialdehyde dehydrogenase n=1 Tax=invertebrate metagenome TaxID=1711999 RepID=A0A484H950_9ZZZZ
MSYRVAIIGATGNVGREMLNILAERNFPAEEMIALASERSTGKEISFGRKQVLKVQNLATFDFTGIDIALSSPGAATSAKHTPRAASSGCVVIDNTSYFRMESDVPLVVPEVNPRAIAGYIRRNIIANPNCSTIQMVVVLRPLHDAFRIRRVVVSTYQSTSGAGREAMDELFQQNHSVLMNESCTQYQKKFAKQIAVNLIPHIDAFMEDGATREEWKMAMETRKILDSSIAVHANCCRVPTFIGHAEYVNIETERPVDATEASVILQNSPGIVVVDHPTGKDYMTPVEAIGKDSVYVSRLRRDYTVNHGLSFWCVADNLRKGAALNAIQIAEFLVQDYLK